jgi:CHAD domain-containing protein
MNELANSYLIPDGTKLEDVKDGIRAHGRFDEEPPRTMTRTFFDDFEWNLYLAGASVEERQDGGQRVLVWLDLRGEDSNLEERMEAAPGFARDLPPGPLRERLAPVLGVRRLLPLVKVHTDVQMLRLLNDDDKTVARLVVEENSYSDPERERQGPLASRLRLLPVRGYGREQAQAALMLKQDLGLEPVRTPLVLEALAAAGRRPGDYSSKLDYHLDPGGRADAVAKEIQLGLLDTIEANVPGAKANLDPEFLHDLRVATRRTRSALTQIKGVFAPDVVATFKERFAWLQQVTGPVRDLDVYLLAFETYRDDLPPSLRPHLNPLRDFLLAHYEEEQQALMQKLESTRFKQLLRDWRAFLEAPVPERSALPSAMRRSKDLADERIWRLCRRVLKEGRAITAQSAPEDLHEVRKSSKKLRYLVEFFASLYPQKDTRKLVKQLKVLLDNLGGFQDLTVQAIHLREIAIRMREEKRAPTDTLLAMGALVGQMLDRQQQARARFAEIFGAFDRKENRALLQQLFAPKGKRVKGV